MAIVGIEARLNAAVRLLGSLNDGGDRALASHAQAAALVQQCTDGHAELAAETSVKRADLVCLAMSGLWEPEDRSTIIRALLADPPAPAQAPPQERGRARASSRASSPAESSGSDRDPEARERRQRRVMQKYMPALLEYLTHNEWSHLF